MASLIQIEGNGAACHLCKNSVESDGVLHTGKGSMECLAHKHCLERDLRVSNECQKCKEVLNKREILFGKKDRVQEAPLEDIRVINLSEDEAFARRLQEEEVQVIEHPGDAELAWRLQEEENQQVYEVEDPDLALARQLQEEENQQVQGEPPLKERPPAQEQFEVFYFDDLEAVEPPVQQAAQPLQANRACNLVAAVVVAAAVGVFSYLNAS